MSSPQPPVATPSRHGRNLSTASAASITSFVTPRSEAAQRMSKTSTIQSTSISPKSYLESVLDHDQLAMAGVVSSLMLCGIMYSLLFDTSLNTSEIHHTHLPLRSAYFARKSNIFNVLFVKRSWAWTSGVYLLHLFSSPRLFSPESPGGSWPRRLGAWVIATSFWALFAKWFFGAGLGDRIIALTGGNCALPIPDGISPELARTTFSKLFTSGLTPAGSERLYLQVPPEYCHGKPITSSHLPELFGRLYQTSNRFADAPGNILGEASKNHESLVPLSRPRWHLGFDISGHSFLLTLCIMLLARELVPVWRSWFSNYKRSSSSSSNQGALGVYHGIVGLMGTALVGIWMWMILMTAVYFHNPPEKLVGLSIGLLASGIINILLPPFPPPSPFNAHTTPTKPLPLHFNVLRPTPSKSSDKSLSLSRSNSSKSATLSRTSSQSQPGSLPDLSEKGEVDLAGLDEKDFVPKGYNENSARRGSVVDGGIIYEMGDDSFEEDEPKGRGSPVGSRKGQ
ncbi:hypothetical protein L202_04574 [Cryptococcus amylolentus CBS 6039]|uniref:Uncharacterized protein n=1 Tax=Cryptococcus amylolentus CBS 6039 TaxID=1295533 RepID=A0A1E3HM28_9TREE|nr:hypothetical protein L202_04574 [Cryptococcus amylolentus CBS 6039]ODN77390.1 hypothetical protein L202_04574 [Cryptococcus amylolentus CBS 6039]